MRGGGSRKKRKISTTQVLNPPSKVPRMTSSLPRVVSSISSSYENSRGPFTWQPVDYANQLLGVLRTTTTSMSTAPPLDPRWRFRGRLLALPSQLTEPVVGPINSLSPTRPRPHGEDETPAVEILSSADSTVDFRGRPLLSLQPCSEPVQGGSLLPLLPHSGAGLARMRHQWGFLCAMTLM